MWIRRGEMRWTSVRWKFWIEYAISDCDDQFGIDERSKLNRMRLFDPSRRAPKTILKNWNGVKPTLTRRQPAFETCHAAVVAIIHIKTMNSPTNQRDIPIRYNINPSRINPPVIPSMAVRYDVGSFESSMLSIDGFSDFRMTSIRWRFACQSETAAKTSTAPITCCWVLIRVIANAEKATCWSL